MNSNPQSITTRTGDQGKTRLFSGEEVSKKSPRTDAYGDLDELVSILGVARSLSENDEVSSAVLVLQRQLFLAGAEMATSGKSTGLLKGRIGQGHIEDIDKRLESLESRIRMPGGFIIPGGTPSAANLDLSRSVVRRVERRAVGLKEDGKLDNDALLIWLNRLSDYLWLLARLEEGGRTICKDAE